MFNENASILIFVCGWSLAAVGVGLICGFFIGKFYNQTHESRKLKAERESTLTALLNLMQSTNQLNVDVDEHNSALESAQQELQTLASRDETGSLQEVLMSNITRVVKSNRRLENDLVVSRFKLESQAQELDRTRQEARTDALCDIGNRKAVDERLQFMISRYHTDRSSFGLMLIDVDHFKRINDTFGHNAGDEVLSSIALALKECVRPDDFVGRLGGDEFVIMLDGVGAENAKMVAARIRSTIELHDFSVDENGQSTVVTLSMGLAVVGPNDDHETLYERADQALYRSKDLGRNRLCTLLEDPDADSDLSADDDSLAQTRSLGATPKGASESIYESFKKSFSSEI
jgi:diguanylate cyclase